MIKQLEHSPIHQGTDVTEKQPVTSAMSTNILYGGVNFNIEGEGGPDCVDFLTESQRWTETLLLCFVNGAILVWAGRNVTLPQQEISNIKIKTQKDERVLFFILLTVFLLEVRYAHVTATPWYHITRNVDSPLATRA